MPEGSSEGDLSEEYDTEDEEEEEEQMDGGDLTQQSGAENAAQMPSKTNAEADLLLNNARGSMRNPFGSFMGQQTQGGFGTSMFSAPEEDDEMDMGDPENIFRASASFQSPNLPKNDMQMAPTSDITKLVGSFVSGRDDIPVDEPDELIIRTEYAVSKCYEDIERDQRRGVKEPTTLATLPVELMEIWESYADSQSKKVDDSPLEQAISISSLLLQLHHPPPARSNKQTFAPFKSSNSISATSTKPQHSSRTTMPIPEVLINYLNKYKGSYDDLTDELYSKKPSATAHPGFWDIVMLFTMHGHVGEALRILKEADFKHAFTAIEDGESNIGYRGIPLGNVQSAINHAIRVLEQCPALDDNWDVKGLEWSDFRNQVKASLSDLIETAEGPERPLGQEDKLFEAENFGVKKQVFGAGSMSQSTRRARSRIPWAVYERLKAFYGVLLGGTSEIVSFAQDWIEASFATTIWWDGNEESEVGSEAFSMSRRSLRRSTSQKQKPRWSDMSPSTAYVRRLASAFEYVTSERSEKPAQINSMDPWEVGVASICQGNIEGTLKVLGTLSYPVAASTARVASFGGWLKKTTGAKEVGAFDESDLMVLNYGSEEQNSTKDNILIAYADGLFERGILNGQRSDDAREGWELAIQVLVHMDDEELATEKIKSLMSALPLDTTEEIEKAFTVLKEFGLEEEACAIAGVSTPTLAHRDIFLVIIFC